GGLRGDIELSGGGTPVVVIARHLFTPHASVGPLVLFAINTVLLGVPGALTPSCSARNVPGYV
ncbi:hypothetical protein AAGG49_21885, partial [Stenotrophomonas maltophilia]